MEWNDYAAEIKELLGLKGEPVAITYSMEPPAAAERGRHRVCDALLLASHGKVIDLTRSSSACPGGTWHLGLGEQPTGEADKALKDFLVNGEKLFCSIAAFHRALALTAPAPVGLAEHVVLSPMARAEFRPDIVVFVCNALQACRLVTLDGYDTGIPPRIEMCGSACHQVVAYPVVTGELNVSFLDYTARRTCAYDPEDLLVSIPYHRFLAVMRSIDYCTAGRAKLELPESFRKLMDADALRDLGA
jgi:uncharacterized protein (DUF169 family)